MKSAFKPFKHCCLFKRPAISNGYFVAVYFIVCPLLVIYDIIRRKNELKEIKI